jgi:hypothetical protein
MDPVMSAESTQLRESVEALLAYKDHRQDLTRHLIVLIRQDSLVSLDGLRTGSTFPAWLISLTLILNTGLVHSQHADAASWT